MSPVVAYVCKACTVLSVVRTTSSLSVWTLWSHLSDTADSMLSPESTDAVSTLWARTCSSLLQMASSFNSAVFSVTSAVSVTQASIILCTVTRGCPSLSMSLGVSLPESGLVSWGIMRSLRRTNDPLSLCVRKFLSQTVASTSSIPEEDDVESFMASLAVVRPPPPRGTYICDAKF